MRTMRISGVSCRSLRRWFTVILFVMWWVFPSVVVAEGQMMIEIIQHDRLIQVADFDEIELTRSTFSIYFPLVGSSFEHDDVHTADFVAWTSSEIFDVIVIDEVIPDSSPFLTGRGMALPREPFSYFILTNEAHSPIMYDPTPGQPQRAHLEREFGAGYHLLRWTVESFILDGEEFSVADSSMSSLYFVAWVDVNDDGQMQSEEVIRWTVNFPT